MGPTEKVGFGPDFQPDCSLPQKTTSDMKLQPPRCSNDWCPANNL